jgi:ferredoxin
LSDMAYYILEGCIECGVCIPECPDGAISEASPFIIDPGLCTECGACAEVCPVDVCVPVPGVPRKAGTG